MTNEIKGPALAEMLGVSTRHLRNLEKSGVIVKTDRGEYALRESVRKFCDYLRGEGEPGGDYERDKARLMKAKADRAEIEAAQKAGKLVLTDRIAAVVESAVGVAVSKLVQVGDKVAPLCILEKTPGPAATLINDGIRAACEELYSMDIAAVAVESSEAVEPMDGGEDAEGADEN